jgi:antitoxin component of MazEF toxin-antitoxin module
MADQRVVATYIGTVTATGGNSSGITIPCEILDSLKWDRGNKVKIVERSDGSMVITKFVY